MDKVKKVWFAVEKVLLGIFQAILWVLRKLWELAKMAM